MDFDKKLKQFKTIITGILDSELPVQDDQILHVSMTLKEFAFFDIKNDNIEEFVNTILIYFVLLNNYAKKYSEITPLQQLNIRKSLSSFMFILDETKIYNELIQKFIRIVDIIVEEEKCSSNLKEYLRIYYKLLNNVSKNVLSKLSFKHKKILTLCEIIKKADDIELQAFIIEVILKLYKSNNKLKIGESLQKIINPLNLQSMNDENSYQVVRIVLYHINENSENIFSINCNRIEFGSLRVLEFPEAANSEDMWLDFNLANNTISFFCDKNLLNFSADIKSGSATSWEVLSFSMKNVTNPAFTFNNTNKILEVVMEIDISAFVLFADVKGVVRNLRILISKASENFDTLIEFVLPKMFGDLFCLKDLDILDNDSSKTESIEIFRKISSSKKVLNSDESQIIISDDEDNIPLKEIVTKNPKKVAASVKGTVTPNNRSFIEKSISPLSCRTEALCEKRSRSSSVYSKISVSNEKKMYKKLKISTIKIKRLNNKISGSVEATKIQDIQESEQHQKDESTILLIEENVLDRNVDINDSITSNVKVEEWLNKIPAIQNTYEELNPLVYDSPDSKIITEIQQLESVSLRNSEKSFTEKGDKFILRSPTKDDNFEEIEENIIMENSHRASSNESIKEKVENNIVEIPLKAISDDLNLIEEEIIKAVSDDLNLIKEEISKDIISPHPLIVEALTEENSNQTQQLLKVLCSQESVKSTEKVIQSDKQQIITEIETTEVTNLEISEVRNKSKRKLYNPNDLSYLDPDEIQKFSEINESKVLFNKSKASVHSETKENKALMKKRKKMETIEEIVEKRQKKSKPKKSDESNKVKNQESGRKNDKQTKSKKRSKTKSEKLMTPSKTESKKNKEIEIKNSEGESSKLYKKNSLGSLNKSTTSTNLKKLFDSVRKQFNEDKKIMKTNSRQKYSQSSSESSWEPFGVAIGNVRKKSNNFTRSDNYKKINILSNVLIQPPHNQTSCEILAGMFNRTYLEFVTWAKTNNKELLKNETCTTISDILLSCIDK